MNSPDRDNSSRSIKFPIVRNAEDQRRPPWLWTGLGGCGLFLCVVVLAASSLIWYRRVSGDVIGSGNPGKATAVLEAQLEPTANVTLAESSGTPKDLSARLATPTIFSSPTPRISANDAARTKLGKICFRLPPDDTGQDEQCGETYPPVVEIHAIFDYVDMSTDNDWTRVWYHNGREALRVQERWSGDQSGQFDYHLNTSDGRPLSPGLWQLELYVDGQLETFGSFIIEPAAEPIPTPVLTPTSSPSPVPTPAPPQTIYRLLFTKWDGGKHAIWTANLDGSGQQFLLDFAASPSWSADGQFIAFYGEEGIDTQLDVTAGTNGVWRMGANGENPTQLLADGSVQSVAWSPDGGLIAFDAARGGPNRRVYFLDPNGNEQGFEPLGEQPAWSPDGQQLVTKVCRPECGLWIVDRTDTNPRQLTGEGSDGLPAWSPDGSAIAFSRDVEGNVDIFAINIDGSGLRRLTSTPGNDSVPTWTPDGRQMTFRTTRNGLWQIYLMNVDGSDQRLIIDNVGASDEWAFDRMAIH